MRRTLLATVAVASLALAAPRPAWAQGMATFDAAQAGHAISELQSLKNQWDTMKSSLTTMENSLTQQTNLLNAVQHGNAVMSIARGLMNSTAQMPGSNSGAVPGMAFGSGLTQPQAQRFYDQNHVYSAQGSDFAAQEMERKQEATANMQGELQTGMDVSDERVSMINEMMYDIQNNDDPTYLSAAQAHIQSEQAFLANEQTKIARLQAVQATQASVDQQRAEQHARQEAEEMHAAAVAAAGVVAMRRTPLRTLPALLCSFVAFGLSGAAGAQEVRDIPYFMRSPEARAATLKLCRNDHRYDRAPECANAASAEDRLWAMRLRAGTPDQVGVHAAPNLDTFQLSPTYWARTRLARRATLATCRLHPGMAYPAKVCAAAEQGELLDTGGRS